MIRELIRWPYTTARTVIELPRAMERSIREANELMEVSREQLDAMRRQADQALDQAERMNDLLSRVVKLTEPLERAQGAAEYVGEGLKKAIFGAAEAAQMNEEAAKRTLEAAEGVEGAARELKGGSESEAQEPPISSDR